METQHISRRHGHPPPLPSLAHILQELASYTPPPPAPGRIPHNKGTGGVLMAERLAALRAHRADATCEELARHFGWTISVSKAVIHAARKQRWLRVVGHINKFAIYRVEP